MAKSYSFGFDLEDLQREEAKRMHDGFAGDLRVAEAYAKATGMSLQAVADEVEKANAYMADVVKLSLGGMDLLKSGTYASAESVDYTAYRRPEPRAPEAVRLTLDTNSFCVADSTPEYVNACIALERNLEPLLRGFRIDLGAAGPVKHLTVRTNAGSPGCWDPRQAAVYVRALAEVPNREGGYPIELVLEERVGRLWDLVLPGVSVPTRVLDAIRRAVRRVLEHELDEGIRVGASRPYDPHPEEAFRYKSIPGLPLDGPPLDDAEHLSPSLRRMRER